MQRVANADVTHEADRSFIVLNFQIRSAAASVASAVYLQIRVIIKLCMRKQWIRLLSKSRNNVTVTQTRRKTRLKRDTFQEEKKRGYDEEINSSISGNSPFRDGSVEPAWKRERGCPSLSFT